MAMMGTLVSPGEDRASREGTWLKKDLGTLGKEQPQGTGEEKKDCQAAQEAGRR